MIKICYISNKEMEELERLRPKTRADCLNSPRPCPWVSCKYHLLWEMPPRDLYQSKTKTKVKGSKTKYYYGELKSDTKIVNFLFAIKETCTLDVASTDNTLEVIGQILDVTRERIRQIEGSSRHGRILRRSALGRCKHISKSKVLREFIEP